MRAIANFVISFSHAVPTLFRIGMWWRIIYGVLRLILGVTLLRMIGEPVAEVVYAVMSHEFSGPRGDAVLEALYNLIATHDMTVTYFVAFYFIFWGVIEVVLSAFLLRQKMSAFPFAIGLIVIFIVYSSVRFLFTHSLVLLGVIIVDIGIVYIIYREYVLLRSRSLTA